MNRLPIVATATALTTPLQTRELFQPPDLDDSDTQSPIHGLSPRTPTLADLPAHVSSQLADWSAEQDGQLDFQVRDAMRYRLSGQPAQWSIPHTTQRQSKRSSLAETGCSHTYGPSVPSSRSPPSVQWDNLAMDYSGHGAAFEQSLDATNDSHHPRSLDSNVQSRNNHIVSTSSLPPPSLTMSGMSLPSACHSVCTGAVIPLSKHLPVLEEDEDDSMYIDSDSVRTASPSPPAYPCTFWFLDCAFSTHSVSEWKTHCLSHFRGISPPRTATCPLCSFTTKGTDAWERRMDHVAEAHHLRGEGLAASAPDFVLFRWLWKKRLIEDALLKELEGDFEGRSGQLHSTVTEGRAREGRREAPVMRRVA